MLALGARQVMVQGANVLGGILLARTLSPAEFGVYAVVLFFMAALVAFSDVGLAANLIRQPDEPDERDYSAVFTMQQVLVGVGVVSLWLASPALASFYQLPPEDAWVFRLIAASLLATSFMVIPKVRMERHMAFDRLMFVEVSQALTFNAAAVILAWQGYGAIGVAVAVLLRALTGVAFANAASPWRIRWQYNWRFTREHLGFGLYIQGSHFASLLRDSVSPVLVGMLLGLQAVGYVKWAGMVAFYPLLVLSILGRVYLPAFARMQAHRDKLGHFVERMLWVSSVLSVPVSVLTLTLIEPITRILFGENWLVALPLFYILWAANLFVPTLMTLIGLLNALGNSRTTFTFTVATMLGNWAFAVPLVLAYGVIGVAIAQFGMQFAALWLYRAAQREVDFRILAPIRTVWAIGLALGLVLLLAQVWFPVGGIVELAVYAVLGLAGYGLALFYCHQKDIRLAIDMIAGR